MKIILASKSPRRRELMDLLNINYEVMVSNVNELLEDDLSMEEQAKNLAFIKARAVFDKTSGDRIIIGADTLVYKGKKKLGKPNNKENAVKMLNELKNSSHKVCTGIAILVESSNTYNEFLDYSISNVHIKDMSKNEIDQWISTGKAFDKAGAYAIQDEFGKFIDHIDGNYYSIVGLPIDKVYDIIKNFINDF